MASWPSTLPDFTEHRISGSFGEGRNVTPSDSGFTQAALRAGAPYDPIEVSQDYTGSQLGALRTFYFTTVHQVEAFDHIDSVTGAACQYRFHPSRPPPSYQHIQAAADAGARSGRYWRVNFTLERLG
jgi:hypothetical protein